MTDKPEKVDFDEINQTRPMQEDDGQPMLFDLEPDWRDHWWGMPSFEMKDARPQYRLTVNFMTADDMRSFAEKLEATKITTRTDSMWYPPQQKLGGQFEFDGEPTDSRYPICIMSKGRADCQTTGRALDRMGTSYKFFVEEEEGDVYKKHLGENKVVVMPFSNLGKGSIPARNFIWEWAKEREFKRHWTVDDNIISFNRTHCNRRLCVRGGGFFKSMEDFVDRYENIAMAGPHSRGFVPDRDPNVTPILWNSRIYSCILLDTNLEERWRGRYNEDTDLSLRLLKAGHCTLLFRALTMDKGVTNYGDGKARGALKGGNTDNVYGEDNDYRRKFAESLKEQHPDVVEIVWKFNRWHHHVDYSPFKGIRPILRQNVTKIKADDDYGMDLVRVKQKGQKGLAAKGSAAKKAKGSDPIPEPVPEPKGEVVDLTDGVDELEGLDWSDL